MYQMLVATDGCSALGWNEYALEMSEMLAEVGYYDGLSYYKKVVEVAAYCDDSTMAKIDFPSHFEKVIKYAIEIKPAEIDTISETFGIAFSPIFNEKSFNSNSECLNGIEDFYYGSNYALMVGETGVVTKLNGLEIDKTCTTNYDSLRHSYTSAITNSEVQKLDPFYDIIYNNNLSRHASKTKAIDSIEFSGSKIVYPKFTRYKSNIASSIWRIYGNSRLEGLDFFYYNLMLDYDNKKDYSKNIEALYKFDYIGLPDFFLGYSRCKGNQIDYLSLIYFYGYKAALISKDSKVYNDFIKLFLYIYNRLTEAEKINFLSQFITATCWNNIPYVDFNTPFINRLYLDFQKLLLTKSKDFWDKLESKAPKIEMYLILSRASQLDSFDPVIFIKLKNDAPLDMRVYICEALYYFQKNDSKLGVISLKKAIELGFKNSDFFINKIEIKKYHSEILDCFK